MPDPQACLQVEVVYALAGSAHIISLQVAPGATIREVIEQSGMLQRCAEIDLKKNRVGIYSRLRQLDDSVIDGDRIEIYRPLRLDPKEARRRRARKQQALSH